MKYFDDKYQSKFLDYGLILHRFGSGLSLVWGSVELGFGRVELSFFRVGSS